MGLTRRVGVLLEPEQYSVLQDLARQRRKSVASLIREAVEREYLIPTREERLEAWRRIVSQEIDFGEWDDIKKAMAEERARQIEAS